MANPGGWMFEDATFLAAEVELQPRAASRLLPWSLRLARPARATLFVAHYPRTSFGSVYSEAGLFIDVRHGFTRAAHCPWMLVDDDVALIAGRDLLGYPKKMGAIELSIDGDTATAHVERRGERVLDMRAHLGATATEPPPMLGRRFRNVAGAIGLGFQRMLAFRPREELIEVRHADIEIDLGQARRDAIHEIVGAVVRGHLYRVNIGGRALPIPIAPVSPTYWLRNLSMRHR